MLTDNDLKFIKEAAVSELREALYYATGRDDNDYARALAAEIIHRKPEEPTERLPAERTGEQKHE